MIADGRSQTPPLPDEFGWIAFTAATNRALGTSYRIEDLQQMPSDQLDLIGVWISHGRRKRKPNP